MVRIHGGLGNQLFALGFARSVALLTGTRIGLDLTSYGADPYGRRYLLGDFAQALGLFETVERHFAGSLSGRVIGRLVGYPGLVREGTPPGDDEAFKALIARGVYFDGYWQEEAYIHDAPRFHDAVRHLIQARGAPGASPAALIHYRTYKEERRPKARMVPSPDYFRQALAQIMAADGGLSEVTLVSDDPALAIERLGDLGAPIRVAGGGSAWDDLALITRARNLILTNSSFSWWGGVCGQAKRVFYPRPQGFIHYARPARNFIQL